MMAVAPNQTTAMQNFGAMTNPRRKKTPWDLTGGGVKGNFTGFQQPQGFQGAPANISTVQNLLGGSNNNAATTSPMGAAPATTTMKASTAAPANISTVQNLLGGSNNNAATTSPMGAAPATAMKASTVAAPAGAVAPATAAATNAPKLSDAQSNIMGRLASGDLTTLKGPGDLNMNSIQDFLGEGGNVTVNPFTGAPIDKKDRQKPLDFISEYLATQGAQEAQNFRFTDLPENMAPDAASASMQAGQNLLSRGGDFLGQGQGLIGNAAQSLLGTKGNVVGAQDNATADREAALNELQSLQDQALSPELNPQQRQEFQAIADQRRADIMSRFAPGGDISNLYQRGQASDLAQLQGSGVLDSTTGANVLAKRDTDLAAMLNQLLGTANEQSVQDVLAERKRIGDTATNFGQLQGQQATGAGGLLAELFGTDAYTGGKLGDVGAATGGIGANLSNLGLQGLNQAGDLSLKGRGLEADLQLGEVGQRLLGNQLTLQNIQSLLNNKENRKALAKSLNIQEDLANMSMEQASQTIWNKIFGGG